MLLTLFLFALFAVSVAASANLEAPANNAWTAQDNDTTQFQFNVSELSATIDCNLTLNGAVVAENASVVADTTTTLYSNTSFLPGANTWYMNCSNSTDENISAVRTLNYDPVAPVSIIEDANHTWFGTTTPTINFNITDNLDTPIAYQFYVDDAADGGASGTVANATHSSDGLSALAQGTHTVIVEATDEAGNKANSSSWTIYVDTSAPTVTLISPVSNLNTSTPAQALSFNVSDNLGSPYNCSLYIDGAYNQSNVSTENATTTVFSVGFAEGAHTWNVSCLDNASNQGSVLRALTVDVTPPVPIIETLNNSWFSTATPTINFNVTDNLFDPISYQFYVDDAADVGATGTAVNATSTPDTLTALAEGSHTLILEATDGAGNKLNSSSWTIYYDATNPTVTPITADNTNVSSSPTTLQFNVSDNLGGPYSCALYIGGVYNNTLNASTLNATTTDLVFGAAEGSYTWYVNCTDNASRVGVSGSQTVALDLAGGPVVYSISLNQPDNFVSDNAVNNQITLLVNATDSGTGVYYITANFTEFSAALGGTTFQNLSYNGATGLWNTTVTVTDDSAYDFAAKNISILAYDYVPQAQSAGQNFTTVIFYNMTRPTSANPCEAFDTATTDFSAETDFNAIDFVVAVQIKRSAACNGLLPHDDSFLTVVRMNFSDINFSDQATAQKISSLHSALEVNITDDGEFGVNRIWLNSSYFQELNTTATINFYWLPFDSTPTVAGDPGTAGVIGTPTYVPFTTAGGAFGNLTFTVNGFSGYNASDTTPPTITFIYPSPNMTTVQGPAFTVNLTVDGTGTQVSNITAVLDDTGQINMPAMSCVNATGSDVMNCSFMIAGLSDGSHGLFVTALDYGGAAGNTNTTTWNFTSDSSAPSVTNNQSNVSGLTVSPTDSILLNVTVTDLTNVSGVTANNVNSILMDNHILRAITTSRPRRQRLAVRVPGRVL